jgi:endonuclease YncB( thermonuclease family)
MPHILFAVFVIWLARYVVKICRIFIYGGRVIKVSDGDTIKVRRWFFKVQTIRLAEIDAPEKSQTGGKEAAHYLSKMIPVGSLVVLQRYGKSGRYNRNISHVYKGFSPKHINFEMVSGGHAWRYTRYSTSDRFAMAESKARSKKLGLWRGKAVSPWSWRKKRKRT